MEVITKMKNLFKATMLVIMLVCALLTIDVFAAETTGNAESYVDPDGRQLALHHNALTMRMGAGTILEANIHSAKKDATGKVTWSTADENVVTIAEDGKLVAVNEGKTTVTARLEGTPITKECSITVVKNPEITISKGKMIVEKGDKVSLKAEVTKSEVDNKEYVISWRSTNKKVAKVDAEGNVTIVGAGTATIKAAINGTDVEAGCKITSLQKGKSLTYGSAGDEKVTTSSMKKDIGKDGIATDNAGNQYRRGKKIGNFVITGYCTRCNSCGPRTTSTGKTATEGITVAVKKGQIALGTKIIIGDHVYIAQDVHGNHRYSKVIDVFYGVRHGSEPFLRNIPVYYAK